MNQKKMKCNYAQALAVLLQQRIRQETGKIMQDLGNPAGHNLRAGVEKKGMKTNSWVLSVFMQKLISARSS